MKDKIRTLTDLGSQLKALRLASGLGVVDIAQKSGRSRDVLNRLEKGGDASLSSVLALLQALGHTIEIVPLGRPSLQEMRRRFAQDEDEHDDNEHGGDAGLGDEPGRGGQTHG